MLRPLELVHVLALGAAVVGLAVDGGCENGGQAPLPRAASTRAGALQKPFARPDRLVSPAKAATELQPRYLFHEHLDQAHLRSGGLLVDFGTAGRNKHTLGDFRSGWRGNFADKDTTFSYLASGSGTILFDAQETEAGGGTIVVRGRPMKKGQQYRLYLNGAPAGAFTLSASSFGYASVRVKGIVPGQNALLLRGVVMGKGHDGGQAALALDYVRVVFDRTVSSDTDDTEATEATEAEAAESASTFDAPLVSREKGELSLQPGESLTFYLPVPEGARLRAAVRPRQAGALGKLVVSAYCQLGAPSTQLEVAAAPASAQLDLPLDSFICPIAALQLSASGAEIVVERAGLYLPAPPPAAAARGALTKAKNVIWLLVDTLRADHLVPYNEKTDVKAAFVARLASESAVFERALAPENWTKPSCASLLTGLFPESHGAKGDEDAVPRSATLASEHFRKLGFETSAFVANGYVSEPFGFQRGWSQWTNYVREGKRNRAEFVTDDVLTWLRSRRGDKPFFLYVHMIDPHVPYMPPKKYWNQYDTEPYAGPVVAAETPKLLERVKTKSLALNARDKKRLHALYKGEVSYADDHAARLYEALAREKRLDDTLLVITADHGEEFFEHGSVGHGHSLYEELLHVPLIIRLPGPAGATPGVRSRAEVTLVDVLPTTCEALSVPCPEGVEGRSVLALAARGDGSAPFPSFSVAEFLGGARAVRMGRWKAIYRGFGDSLFDLETDPGERSELKAERPMARAALRDALGKHLGRFVDQERAPGKSPARHKPEKTKIDAQTKRQLQQLGYMQD